jgi:multiple sugar transport system permease protein
MKEERPWLFILSLILPGLAIFLTFAFYPVTDALIGSLFDWYRFSRGQFVGIQNYIQVVNSYEFLNISNLLSFEFPMGAFPQNLIWMVIHVPLSMFLGLGIALLLQDLKGAFLIRSCVFIGMVTPLVVVGILFLFLYDPQAGLANALLRVIGLGGFAQDWLSNPQVAIFALILGGVWVQTGFSLLLYSSALTTVPDELIDAASVDGASPWQRFRHVIWPSLKPTTMTVLMMGLVWVLRVFGIVYSVSPTGGPGGAFSVLGLEVYRSAFTVPIHFGKAMTIAVFELAIATPAAIYIIRMRRT